MKIDNLILLTDQCINALSLKLKHIKTYQKQTALEQYKNRLIYIKNKYEIISNERLCEAILGLVKIVLITRNSSSGTTSSGKTLLKLVNTRFLDLGEVIKNKLGVEDRTLKYNDLLMFAGYKNQKIVHEKRAVYFNSWKENIPSPFSIIRTEGSNQLLPGHIQENVHLLSNDWSQDIQSYILPQESDIFREIQSYIENNIQNAPYTSQIKEETRMSRARDMATKSINLQFKQNCFARLHEGEINAPPPPSSCDIQIEKIVGICNTQLLEPYIRARDEILASVRTSNKMPLKDINWANETDTLPVIDNQAGEVMLLTQPTPGVEKIIASSGFDPNRGTAIARKFKFGGSIETKGMLGGGSYFSDSFSKCMTYSYCPNCGAYICECENDNSLRVAILARVLLGIPKNRPGIMHVKKRTEMRAYNPTNINLNKIGRHSIYAKGAASSNMIRHGLTIGAGVNEFCIHNRNQIYPEFIIYWRPKYNAV